MITAINRRREAFRIWVEAKGGVKAVAERTKVPTTTLYSYLAGKSQSLLGITEDAISVAFGVQSNEIFGSKAAMVPVIGYVGPGAEAMFYTADDAAIDEAPPPEGSGKNTVALEVRGEGLGPFFSGWLIFYDNVHMPVTPDLHGQLCVVGLPDRRVMVKLIKASRDEGRYHLMSQTDGHLLDQTIDWAARVMAMIPR
jgi:hypothetical protein